MRNEVTGSTGPREAQLVQDFDERGSSDSRGPVAHRIEIVGANL